MTDEAVGHADHPIPADNIARGLRGRIPRDRAPDPGILTKDVVDPPFDDQPVLEEVLAHIRIPEEGPVVPGESTRILLPAIIADRINLQAADGKPAQLEIMVLGPEVRGKAGVNGADGGAVIGASVQSDAVAVGDIFSDGKAAPYIEIIVMAENISDIVNAPPEGKVGVPSELDARIFELMIHAQVEPAVL